MKKQMYKTGLGYLAFLHLTNFATRCHYRSITLKGTENLPKGESYILAPCHQQALMDPLVILSQMRKPIVFLARADVFAKPKVKSILTWLKMMPIYRIRDGKESLGKNNAIFDRCKEVLLHQMPLCLMAEGRHNNKHQLLPLVKGMFRIAGETQKALGDKPLYIVPMGLDYDDYEQTYPRVVVNIGKPIDIRPFMEQYESEEPVALNQMRNALSESLQQEMHHVASTQHYDDFYTICQIAQKPMMKKAHRRNNSWNRFVTRREITAKLDAMEAQSTETPNASLEQMLKDAQEFRKLCKEQLYTVKLAADPGSYLAWIGGLILIACIIVACILQPWALWAVLFALICFPLAVVPTHYISRQIIKDPQFRSTANFGIRYGFSIVYTMGLFITILCCHGLLWALASLAMVVVMARLSGYLTCLARFLFNKNDIHVTAAGAQALKVERLKELQKSITKRLCE